jgi:hypothetical protein
MYMEREDSKVNDYNNEMKVLVYDIEVLKRAKKFNTQRNDIYDMNKYAWMVKKDQA